MSANDLGKDRIFTKGGPISKGGARGDTCGLAAFAGLVGQPGAALNTVARDGPLRVIGYGQIATADFNAARLTVRLDAAGLIVSLTCG